MITSCENSDSDPLRLPANTNIVEINATSYEKWVYFSFEEEDTVSISDYLTSMDWDIGFHRFDVRLNCGTAGPGEGGSIDMGIVNFDSVGIAPESGYSLNDSIGIIDTPGNWVHSIVPGDTVFNSWLTFKGPPPTYTINNNIYVIKTAAGKYAKIWLKDYHNNDADAGYITMQYSYQSDGSTSLN